MMTGISAQEAYDKRLELPNLLVLGAGNSMDGLQNGSTMNAFTASELIMDALAPSDFAITSGYGPDNGQVFPRSEAEAMGDLIRDSLLSRGITTQIYSETKSRDTIANISGIAPIVEELDINALAVVAAKGHADRAALMGRRILGKKIEIVPVYSREISIHSKIKELGLRGIYSALTFGANQQSDRLETAHSRYRLAVKLPKMAVSGFNLSSRY
jgi:uncharacterized SAM-binding protein YcdF (DUF218 family)